VNLNRPYCNLFADAVLDGLAESTAGLGVDLGAMEDVGSMKSKAPPLSLIPRDSPLRTGSPLLAAPQASLAPGLGESLRALRSVSGNEWAFVACASKSFPIVFELQVPVAPGSGSPVAGRWSFNAPFVSTITKLLSAYGPRLANAEIELFKPSEVVVFENFSGSLFSGAFHKTLTQEFGSQYPRGFCVRASPAPHEKGSAIVFSGVQEGENSPVVMHVQGAPYDVIRAAETIAVTVSDRYSAGIPVAETFQPYENFYHDTQ
jgi:hypothetical protein